MPEMVNPATRIACRTPSAREGRLAELSESMALKEERLLRWPPTTLEGFSVVSGWLPAIRFNLAF